MEKLYFHYIVPDLPTVVAKNTKEISRKAKGTEDKIQLLLSFDHTNTLSSFDPNFYLKKFDQRFEDYKIKMSHYYKKQTPTRQPATPKFLDIEEEEDDSRDDESDADYLYHNHVDVSPHNIVAACSHSHSPFKQMAPVGLVQP
jgi:hypothetical protein